MMLNQHQNNYQDAQYQLIFEYDTILYMSIIIYLHLFH